MGTEKNDRASVSPLWEVIFWAPRLHVRETTILQRMRQQVQDLLRSGHNSSEEWDHLSWCQAKTPSGCVAPSSHPADDEYCSSPLFSAILDDHTELATLLLEHGADTEQRTRQGLTALHLAVRLMKKDFVELLVGHGANLAAATIDPDPSVTVAGCLAVHHAVLSARLDILRDLLELGADAQATTTAGWSILDIATLYQRVDIIRYLWQTHPSLSHEYSQHSGASLVDVNVAQSETDRQIASHLVNRGAQSTDKRRKSIFVDCMRKACDYIDLQIYATEDIGKIVSSEAETILIKMAGLSDQLTWDPGFCKKCSEFMSQNNQRSSQLFEHSPDTSCLRQSALLGCPLCQVLSKTLDRDFQDRFRTVAGSQTNDSRVRLKTEFPHKYTGWFTGDDLGALVVECERTRSKIDLGLVDEQTRTAVFNTGPSDLQGSGSVCSLAVAKAWLDHCELHHEKCRIEPVPRLPARVIAVGDSDKEPFLLCSADISTRYTALSYCWGGVANLQTITANLQQHQHAIPFQEMPKTIQDAVTITRALGISYLWVDSLCIVQDSAEDFKQQAALMGDIYANAVVTIAAKDASNSTVGCLSDRGRESTAILPLKFIVPRGSGNEPHRSPRINTALLFPKLDKPTEKGRTGVLDSRGWTLQEQLLSRRILNCWDHELSWSCLERNCSEFNPRTPAMFRSVHEDNAFRSRLAIAQRSPRLPPPLDSSDELFGQWLGIVQEYSKRRLSDPRDRIIALAGLQSRFAHMLDDAPLLGGWRGHHFWPSLLWYSPSIEQKSTTEQATSYPSWSWPSAHGPVTFLTRGLGRTSHFDPVVTAWNLEVLEPDVRVQGSLTVKCKLLPGSALNVDEDDLNDRADFTFGPVLAHQSRAFQRIRRTQRHNQTKKHYWQSCQFMLLVNIPASRPPRYGLPASPQGIPASALFMVLERIPESGFRKVALYQEYEHDSWRSQLRDATVELF